MCGIAGIHGAGDVEAMVRRIAHRGPDDEGVYREGPVQLAVRRLAVIDLETGHQPLSSPSGRLWIAFQIRATAKRRLVNRLSGVKPGMEFYPGTR